MKIIIILAIMSCIKNSFKNHNKYKNDINYYFSNPDKICINKITYVIEEAEKGNIKALFLYVYLLGLDPYNQELLSKLELLRDTNNLIEYLQNNNEFIALGILYQYGIKGELEADLERAINYYNKAINIGNSKGTYYLKLLNQKELKSKYSANINETIKYYSNSMEICSSNLANNLGDLYRYEIERDLESNAEKAIKYYSKAISIDYDQVSLNLLHLYNLLVNQKLDLSRCEAIKCAFNLYEKHNYIHGIISETFLLYKSVEKFNKNNCKNMIQIYEDNIKECYGIVLGKKIANDKNSTISSFIHIPISSDLFISYEYICKYLESLLALLPYLNNWKFMIDCIKLKDRSNFNNNEADYVNVIDIEGDEYICLGEYEAYESLVNIINSKDMLLNHINKILNSIDNSSYIIKALNEIKEVESQFQEVLIQTSSERNNNFINKYSSLFK